MISLHVILPGRKVLVLSQMSVIMNFEFFDRENAINGILLLDIKIIGIVKCNKKHKAAIHFIWNINLHGKKFYQNYPKCNLCKRIC